MPYPNLLAYQVLRDYLGALLRPTAPDQPLSAVPEALRPSLRAFMLGKTEQRDAAGQRLFYAADLAAWAADLLYGAGLPEPLPLAALAAANPPTESPARPAA